jgi:hypothetical protein
VTARRGALALALAALALGCGRRAEPRPVAQLPPAGSPRDDGRGLIARMSSRPTAPSDAGPVASPRPTGEHAGARYADYVFTPKLEGVPTGAPAPYRDGYEVITVEHGGSIAGSVRWSRAAPARPATRGCPGAATAATDRVAGAVVFLEDIARGRGHLARGSHLNRRLQLGGALELGPCGLAPRVQLAAPIGALLTIATRRGAAELEARWASTPGEPAAAAEPFALVPGAASERMLERSGWLELRAGDAAAWIVVEPHPYFALTSADGDFVLDRVPPGSYQLAVWLPPEGGAPAQLRRQRVQVRASQRAHARFVLPR